MTVICTAQAALFDCADALPSGLAYMAEFISQDEQRELIALVCGLPLHEARYKTYTARRRVFAYGARFDFEEHKLSPRTIGDLPDPLSTLRQRLAWWAGIDPHDFVHMMVAEYQKGTPLGWHRDAPAYELIAGVSLGSTARLRFRPYPPDGPNKGDIIALDLAPRSAYVMRGVARWGWQHSVPPVPGLRYSVTMRTARAGYVQPQVFVS